MTVQLLRGTLGALALCLVSACELDLAEVAGPPSLPAPEVEDGGVASAPLDGEVADSAVAAHHGACASALSPPLPPEPLVVTDATGRPLFDHWRDLACDDASVASYPTCASYRGEPIDCDACVGPTALCSPTSGSDPRPGFAALTAASPACVASVPLAAKRKACCDGSDSFCGAWPYAGAAKPGQPCAVHADCEPGLLCKAPNAPPFFADEMGYGLCTCPELEFEPSNCATARLP